MASARTATTSLKKAIPGGATNKTAKAKAKTKSKGQEPGKDVANGTAFRIFEWIKEHDEVFGIEADMTMHHSREFSVPFIFCGDGGAALDHPFQKLLAANGINEAPGNEEEKMLLQPIAELKKFQDTFQKSDLRLTTGKGSMNCSDAVDGFVRTAAMVFRVKSIVEKAPACKL